MKGVVRGTDTIQIDNAFPSDILLAPLVKITLLLLFWAIEQLPKLNMLQIVLLNSSRW